MPGIVKYVIRIFVLHASIAKPLGEGGKLQLTTDMAELEFSLNAFLADGSQGQRGGSLERLGEEYKALRAMRWDDRAFPPWTLYSRHLQTALVSRERVSGVAGAHRGPLTARCAAPHSRPFTVATPTYAPRLARIRVCTLGGRALDRGSVVAHRR